MADYFALLAEPRRPWLDPELLKAKFHALTASVHPDRVHRGTESEKQAANQRYAELNAAYHCLLEPKDRLRHLLELERGDRVEEVQQISSGTMDLFMEISDLCREADAFLAETASVTSPLLKVVTNVRMLNPTGPGVYAPGTRSWACAGCALHAKVS